MRLKGSDLDSDGESDGKLSLCPAQRGQAHTIGAIEGIFTSHSSSDSDSDGESDSDLDRDSDEEISRKLEP